MTKKKLKKSEQKLEFDSPPTPFLKFTDEKTWLKSARKAGFFVTVTDEKGNETEELQAYTDDHSIDVIGVIKVGGEWDENGTQTVAPTTLDGFHVNYLGDLPDGWKAFTVTPKKPYRVFA